MCALRSRQVKLLAWLLCVIQELEGELSKRHRIRYYVEMPEDVVGMAGRCHGRYNENKVGYKATLVACGWAGSVLEKVTRASGQEPYAQKARKLQKSK